MTDFKKLSKCLKDIALFQMNSYVLKEFSRDEIRAWFDFLHNKKIIEYKENIRFIDGILDEHEY